MSGKKELTKTDKKLVMNPVEDEMPLERIDALIWKYVGLKSVREIAELVGWKPEQVMNRKREMLEEVDSLSIQQKRQRFLVELDGMAREARERAAGTIDEYYAGMINAATSNIKTSLQELARMEKQDQGKIEALNNLRIKELLRLIDVTVARAVTEIASTHDLEETELMEVFQGHLVEAAREVEAN